MPDSIRSILAGPVSTNTHSQPSLMSSSMASTAASTSNSFGFLVLPRRVHQLASYPGDRDRAAPRACSPLRRAQRGRCNRGLAHAALGVGEGDDAESWRRLLGAMWYQPGRSGSGIAGETPLTAQLSRYLLGTGYRIGTICRKLRRGASALLCSAASAIAARPVWSVPAWRLGTSYLAYPVDLGSKSAGSQTSKEHEILPCCHITMFKEDEVHLVGGQLTCRCGSPPS